MFHFNNSLLVFPSLFILVASVACCNGLVAIGWTRELDEHFKMEAELFHLNPSDSLPTGTLRWQYIGTPNGVLRMYPGDVHEQCASNDPRIQPWYVAATNGPLNVVLVLDTSASMVRYNRLRLMKEAALRIVDIRLVL